MQKYKLEMWYSTTDVKAVSKQRIVFDAQKAAKTRRQRKGNIYYYYYLYRIHDVCACVSVSQYSGVCFQKREKQFSQ